MDDLGHPLSPSSGNSASGRFWCYECGKEVALPGNSTEISCPDCSGGFVESLPAAHSLPRRRRLHGRRRRRHSSDESISFTDAAAAENSHSPQISQILDLLALASRSNETATWAPNRSSDDNPGLPINISLEGGSSFSISDSLTDRNLDVQEAGTGYGAAANSGAEFDGWFSDDDEFEDREYALRMNGSDSAETTENGAESSRIVRRRSAERNLQQYLRNMLYNIAGNDSVEVSDGGALYTGNPFDYLDSQGFEQLLLQLAENDNTRRGAPPAAKSAIDSLPLIVIEQKHIDDGSAGCAVCKEIAEIGEEVKQLPCLHVYHDECIRPWLSYRNSCPICRFELPTEDSEYEDLKRSSQGAATGVLTEVVSDAESSTEESRRHSGVVSSRNASDPSRSNSRDIAQGSITGSELTEFEELQEGIRTSELNEGERAQPRRGGQQGWFFLAAGPMFRVMGFVLVLCLGNHFINNRLNQQTRRLRQVGMLNGNPSRRPWWMLF